MLKITLAWIFVLVSSGIYACDICGSYMGITPYNNYSSFGIFYRYRAYNGYNAAKQSHDLFPTTIFRSSHGGEPHGEPGDSVPTQNSVDRTTYEIYRIIEARAKYFIRKKVEINAIAPIYFNSATSASGLEKVRGIGDISLFAGYHVISKIEEDKIKHRLIAGGGLKLKTGRYNLKDNSGKRYDALLQPGTGTTDILSYVNYTFGIGNLGLSTNLLYKINGRNRLHERISNSINNSSSIFYMLKKGNVMVVPSAQFYYESTKGLKTNGEHVEGTQINEIMAGPGLDLFFKNFAINCAFQFTTFENAPEHHPVSAGRMLLGLSYNLSQKKYLL